MLRQRKATSLGRKNDSRYLKLALPKTLRKVKSGSIGVLLPACLDMRKGKNLTISGTRNRPGHREGKYLGKTITGSGQVQAKPYPRQTSGCKPSLRRRVILRVKGSRPCSQALQENRRASRPIEPMTNTVPTNTLQLVRVLYSARFDLNVKDRMEGAMESYHKYLESPYLKYLNTSRFSVQSQIWVLSGACGCSGCSVRKFHKFADILLFIPFYTPHVSQVPYPNQRS